MKDRFASLFPLAMLVLLAALTFWLNRVIQGDNPRGPQRHDPDYWVEHFEVRRFNPTASCSTPWSPTSCCTTQTTIRPSFPHPASLTTSFRRRKFRRAWPTSARTARRSTWSMQRPRDVRHPSTAGAVTHGARYPDAERSFPTTRKGKYAVTRW
jgi:hypothetical protein